MLADYISLRQGRHAKGFRLRHLAYVKVTRLQVTRVLPTRVEFSCAPTTESKTSKPSNLQPRNRSIPSLKPFNLQPFGPSSLPKITTARCFHSAVILFRLCGRCKLSSRYPQFWSLTRRGTTMPPSKRPLGEGADKEAGDDDVNDPSISPPPPAKRKATIQSGTTSRIISYLSQLQPSLLTSPPSSPAPLPLPEANSPYPAILIPSLS